MTTILIIIYLLSNLSIYAFIYDDMNKEQVLVAFIPAMIFATPFWLLLLIHEEWQNFLNTKKLHSLDIIAMLMVLLLAVFLFCLIIKLV